MAKCRVCDRQFVYDDEHGYSRDVCSPICDGIEIGMARARKEFAWLSLKEGSLNAEIEKLTEDQRLAVIYMADAFRRIINSNPPICKLAFSRVWLETAWDRIQSPPTASK